ncbi:MAG: DUF5333 domain-containing protein [Roseovarius sp.]
MRMTLIATLILGLSAGPLVASAQTLAKEEAINAGLFTVAVANKIRKRCDAIAPRMFQAMNYLEGLKAEARRLGYSNAEIDAYVSDPVEKDKMDARRDTYIRAQGADPDNGPSMCVLGQREIASQSPIGKLLRAK